MDKIGFLRTEIERLEKNHPDVLVTAAEKEAFDFALELVERAIDNLPEDASSEDLEKAAKEYEDGLGYYECMNQWPSVAFKAGAKWDRGQMMKGAEPAEIGYFNQNGLSILPERSIKRMNFDEGDKVKIIIVKEDKK